MFKNIFPSSSFLSEFVLNVQTFETHWFNFYETGKKNFCKICNNKNRFSEEQEMKEREKNRKNRKEILFDKEKKIYTIIMKFQMKRSGKEKMEKIKHSNLCEYIEIKEGENNKIFVISEAYTVSLYNVITQLKKNKKKLFIMLQKLKKEEKEAIKIEVEQNKNENNNAEK